MDEKFPKENRRGQYKLNVFSDKLVFQMCSNIVPERTPEKMFSGVEGYLLEYFAPRRYRGIELRILRIYAVFRSFSSETTTAILRKIREKR